MSQIVVLEIPELLSEGEYVFWASKVSEVRREQIGKFIHREDAWRSLLGEVLVRTAIRDNLGYLNEEIRFDKNEFGKPSLAGNSDFSFNVSHSGRWVALIFGKDALGLDVEEIRPIDLTIAERFFTKGEFGDLMQRPEAGRIEYFYDLWTLKESYIKAVGSGLSCPLDSFSVSVRPDGSITLALERSNFHFKQYEIHASLKCSACSGGDDLPEQTVAMNMDRLYTFWQNG